jgi:hypothetical protein
MPPAISIMDAPEIAPVTLPAKGMRIGRRRQYLDGTLHKRQTRFHSISMTTRCPSTPKGLQRVDQEVVQQIMVACATSVRNCLPADGTEPVKIHEKRRGRSDHADLRGLVSPISG